MGQKHHRRDTALKRALVLTEGQTESLFIKKMLSPYFVARCSTFLIPKMITTKRPIGRPHYMGGTNSYGQIKSETKRLLNDSDAVFVTTMIDYYAFPGDAPGMNSRPPGPGNSRVTHVESAIEHDLKHPRFVAHLTLHETEALAFTDIDRVQQEFPAEHRIEDLRAIRSVLQPEEINEQPETSPSHRLLQLFPEYRKTINGLDRIRAACPHFNAWLTRLESLRPT